MLSIAPPTECSLAITLPSAQLSNKGGATTHPQGSIRNIKVHPGSSNSPSDWNIWEEYLQSKPGELTLDQTVTKIAWNKLKIDRTVASVVLLHCGCLSLNPFIEFSIWNNSSSSDVLSIQASISISPKYESQIKDNKSLSFTVT